MILTTKKQNHEKRFIVLDFMGNVCGMFLTQAQAMMAANHFYENDLDRNDFQQGAYSILTVEIVEQKDTLY